VQKERMMRNENIKHELNEIPQDFDREQIWSSIQLPKKKQRRRWFFWMTLSGIVFILSVLLTVHLLEDDEKWNAKSAKYQQIEEPLKTKIGGGDIEGASELVDEESESEKNGISESTSKESDVENSVSNSAYTKKIDTPNVLDENGSKNFNVLGNIETKDQKKQFLFLESPRTNIIKNDNIKVEDNQSISLLKVDDNSNAKEEERDFTGGENLDNIIRSIPNLSLPLSIGYYSDYRIEPKFSIAVHNNIKNVSKYGVSFFSLLGTSNHNFGSSKYTEKRENDEKPLESISIGLLGKKSIGKAVLYSGISFSRHNTHLTHQNKDHAILNSAEGQVNRIITTDYSLYNSYQYVDLVMGIGYEIPFSEKWSLTPSVQLGYSLDFTATGFLFNQFDEVENLTEITEYEDFGKWQGQTNLKISRDIGAQWEVGILAYLNTKKSLAGFDDDPHSVYSHGFGLSISRLFR